MKIGLIRHGGVGKVLIKLIAEKSPALEAQGVNLEVICIMGSKKGLYNPQGIDCAQLLAASKDEQSITVEDTDESRKITSEFVLQNKNIDLLVELTDTNKETGEPARSYILRVLQNRTHVVTGSRGSIVHSYRKLAQVAKENGMHLEIGCTCGGALPSVDGGTVEMVDSEVYSIESVLNGATNYTLKEMEDTGCIYGAALEKVRAYGITEANPNFDVNRWGTAFKLLILTNVVMKQSRKLPDIQMGGITDLAPKDIQTARAGGKRYKLIGRTIREEGTLQMVVGPEKLGAEHLLYHVDGKNKTVRYESDTLGELTLIGGASDTTAAAASILRDIVSTCSRQPVTGERAQELAAFWWIRAVEGASRCA